MKFSRLSLIISFSRDEECCGTPEVPGQRAGGGAGDHRHHGPHPHLLPPPGQVRVVPRPLCKQHSELSMFFLYRQDKVFQAPPVQ